jgi:hypothetical protein
MKSPAKKEQKERHDFIREVKRKIAEGEPTSFKERNILNIHLKKQRRKQS